VIKVLLMIIEML